MPPHFRGQTRPLRPGFPLDAAQTAERERPVAEGAARLLVQVSRLGPADVAAPGALAGREVHVRTGKKRASLTAGKTLERARGH